MKKEDLAAIQATIFWAAFLCAPAGAGSFAAFFLALAFTFKSCFEFKK